MICKELSLKSLVGDGYKDFWNSTKRYRLVKGSRASKKSKTMALWCILNLKAYPLSNILVVRRYFNTLRDSCYSELQWAVTRLGFSDEFRFTTSPLEITYLPTGQKILFRGFDDPVKLTSITVAKGVLCWVWLEEAYELNNEADFNKLDLSIRGEMPDGYYKQFTFTFNAWSDTSWLKKRFFDVKSDDITALTTTYKTNEWLDDEDLKLFEDMRLHNPRRYKIEGLGEWGTSEGLIYNDVVIRDFDYSDALCLPEAHAFFGLDFGFTDPTAFVGGVIAPVDKVIFIVWEFYKSNITNIQIAKAIKSIGVRREIVWCDSAEPKSIKELRDAGINAQGADKGKDSVHHGIQYIQGFKIMVHTSCNNFIHEIKNYAYAKDRQGNSLDKPDHEFSHGMDALRYGIMSNIKQKGIKFNPKNLRA